MGYEVMGCRKADIEVKDPWWITRMLGFSGMRSTKEVDVCWADANKVEACTNPTAEDLVCIDPNKPFSLESVNESLTHAASKFCSKDGCTSLKATSLDDNVSFRAAGSFAMVRNNEIANTVSVWTPAYVTKTEAATSWCELAGRVITGFSTESDGMVLRRDLNDEICPGITVFTPMEKVPERCFDGNCYDANGERI